MFKKLMGRESGSGEESPSGMTEHKADYVAWEGEVRRCRNAVADLKRRREVVRDLTGRMANVAMATGQVPDFDEELRDAVADLVVADLMLLEIEPRLERLRRQARTPDPPIKWVPETPLPPGWKWGGY